jgi:hypothetical protein
MAMVHAQCPPCAGADPTPTPPAKDVATRSLGSGTAAEGAVSVFLTLRRNRARISYRLQTFASKPKIAPR